MKTARFSRAFTLIELLVVIAIIGVLAAIVAPTLGSFRKGDAIAAATSQLLGGVARARQLAISQRADVYMVFLPTNYFSSLDWSQLSPAQRVAVTNLADKPLSAYTFVSTRTVGDQPGQRTFRYLGKWQQLPEGVFIPHEKFSPAVNPYTIQDPGSGDRYNIYRFPTINIPFPSETNEPVNMPYIGFDSQGRLLNRPVGENGENIPLAQGSVLTPRDPRTKQVVLDFVDAQERPVGNSTNIGFNIVHVDWLTGRGQLHRYEIR